MKEKVQVGGVVGEEVEGRMLAAASALALDRIAAPAMSGRLSSFRYTAGLA